MTYIKPAQIIKLFAFLLMVVFSSQSYAKVKLYYAGIAYMGNYSAKNILYKYSSQLIDENETLMQTALSSRIKLLKNDNVEIISDGRLGNSKNNDAITMAFALDNENISIENIGGEYKIDVDIRANILVFDFNSMMVIASYPIAIQFRDFSKTNPSESYLKKIVRDLYLENKKVNIFDEFINRLSTLKIKRSDANTVKVRNVFIKDGARTKIPRINQEYVEDNYKAFLAQMFSTYLSKNHNISVLPYTVGHAIGNKMAVRLSNGDVYNLSVPSETYSIDIELRKLKKANVGENEYIRRWAYGTYIGIKLLIPDSDVIYMDAKFRKLVKKETSTRMTHTVDDWSIYKESIYRFFDEFTKNISETDGDWLEGVTRTENILDQFEKFNEKILSCK